MSIKPSAAEGAEGAEVGVGVGVGVSPPSSPHPRYTHNTPFTTAKSKSTHQKISK